MTSRLLLSFVLWSLGECGAPVKEPADWFEGSVPGRDVLTPFDDFALVGADMTDACREAKWQKDAFRDFAAQERSLTSAMKLVHDTCGMGKWNMKCVQGSLNHPDRAVQALSDCQLKSPPEPTKAAAVCKFADLKLQTLKKYDFGWNKISWIMDQAAENCTVVPWQCVNMIEVCMDAKDHAYCFKECLRTGNYQHQVKHWEGNL